MKKFQALLLAIFMSVSLALVPVQLVAAASTNDIICGQIHDKSDISGVDCSGQKGLIGFIGKLVNGFIFIVGALAVIMVIVGGVMYVTAGGNPDQTKRAGGVISSAVIGLVVAVLAYAIVHFVLGSLFK